MFHCDHCGCCCRHLDRNSAYAQLDRGDGICVHLNGNDCTIYENRPLLCRIDECYEQFFYQIMTREDYYELNSQACQIIKKMEE